MEKISEESQLEQVYTHKDESFFDVPIPPLRCLPKMLETNYDERHAGHPKECKNVVGKITLESSNKIDMRYIGEGPTLSINQEGCSRSKDHYAFQAKSSHVILPSKKSTKNLRKLQPLVVLDQQVNDHKKQIIAPSWDFNTTSKASTSNNLGIL